VTYQPKPGDIGITRISGWGGLGIRAAQWLDGCGFADFEHAYVVTEAATTWRRVMIVEAMPGGAVQVFNWHRPEETVYLRCPDEFRESVVDAAVSFAIKHTPYSELDYLAQAAHRLHIPAPHLKAYIESSGSMICSQLADRAASLGGWHLFDDGRWDGYVPPCNLYQLYQKQEAGRFFEGGTSR
jgi:hypothetical protein